MRAQELEEEFGIRVDPHVIIWERAYPSADFPGKAAHFFVGTLAQDHVDAIVFGDEGQQWALVHIDALLVRDDFVPRYAQRLRDYLTDTNGWRSHDRQPRAETSDQNP